MTSAEHSVAAPDPGKIIELSMAFCAAKVLFTAVDLELFDRLAERSMTAKAIGVKLGLSGRAVPEFLEALVRLDLLERRDGTYHNSTLSAQYLTRDSSAYLGHFLDRTNRVLYPAWDRFGDALRTGEAQLDQPRAEGNMFVNLYRDPDGMRNFLAMMDALTSVIGPVLAQAVEWSRYRSVVDVGGARGNLLAGLLQAHPHLSARVFDLPPVEPAFQERMAELSMTGRVEFTGGDFFTDPLPAADVLIFGHVLEDWSPEQRQQLVKNAYQAVRPGGALLVYDPMLDEELSGLVNVLTSLTMLVATKGGSEYTSANCREWMRQAGFTSTSASALGSSDILVIGYKGEI